MYHSGAILSHAEQLATEIARAPDDTRLKLQPKFAQVLHEMRSTGTAVPPKLRNLHEQLLEEAIEARFDNLPV